MKAVLSLLCVAVCFQSYSAEPEDVTFRSNLDRSLQKYVELLPTSYQVDSVHDVVIALHGHGSDRWQFVKDPRGECRAVRDVSERFGLIVVSPDYRAKTSWMGPSAVADMRQIVGELKLRHNLGRVFLAGGSMGGTSALILAVLHPEIVSGVCSLNGTANMMEFDGFKEAIAASYGGSKSEVPEEYRSRSAELWAGRLVMPVALTTGGKDEIVPPQSALRLGEALKLTGATVLSLHREEGGHATTYEDSCAALVFMLRSAGLTPRNISGAR